VWELRQNNNAHSYGCLLTWHKVFAVTLFNMGWFLQRSHKKFLKRS